MLQDQQIGVTALGICLAFGSLAALSLLQVALTDAGGVSLSWDQAVRCAAHPSYSLCVHSGQYKPPRAHYDVITRRIVLNFDHFCPWVVNSIGFLNRKFFILFLIYMTITSFIILCILGPHATTALQMPPEGVTMDIPMLMTLWSVASHALVIAPLILFTGAHIYMACMNETSIEDKVASMPYNHGIFSNLQSVFGESPWTWPLPFWGWGPLGDGIHWQGVGSTIYGDAQPGTRDIVAEPLLPTPGSCRRVT